MKYVVGVDIGGTFTDCVAIDQVGGVVFAKAPSTHASSPAEGVLAGFGELAANVGLTLPEFVESIDQFSHGTTIGTNLVVERRGGPVGLLTTRGHADALGMMRGRGRTAGVPADLRSNVRDTDKPAPIVPRRYVREITERITRDGEVLVQLNEAAAREAIHELVELGVDALAISLIWGFRYPQHEIRLRELANEIAPDLYVSLSSEIAPRQGEYERTVATVINSYVGPASSRYLDELATQLDTMGLTRPPLIMQSNGGVLPIAVASHRPIQTIGSGPAGGLAGTAAIALRSGHPNVITTDMGGTSFEVGLLVNGRPVLATENTIDQYTFRVSQLDVRSIACGGGSIASLDPHSGGLLAGPESAGSYPGPACYGVGDQPTITDADVVVGLIDPDAFLAGTMQLDRERSRQAFERLGAQMGGISAEAAAAGVLRVNSSNAATLIRQRTIEKGLDPREFVVYAFGGAGPVHAFGFADELGVDRVVIPMGNGASTLSAFGIAVSDVVQIFERECSFVAPFDVERLSTFLDAVGSEARAAIHAAGYADENISLDITALARYDEQLMQEIEFQVPADLHGDETAELLGARFREQYKAHFGEAALAVFQAIEIFSVRVTARVELGLAQLATAEPVLSETAGTARVTRPVFWPGQYEWIDTEVHQGVPLLGTRVTGPAVIQLPHTTISVAPGQFLETDKDGNAVLFLKEQTS